MGSAFDRMAAMRVQIKVVTASLDDMYLTSELEQSREASIFNAAIFAAGNRKDFHVSPDPGGGHVPG